MGTIRVTIEKGPELFDAWAADMPGIYGAGLTINEVKQSIMDAIAIYKSNNLIIPKELDGAVEIEWNFDLRSFLQFFSGVFSKAALEKITGVNQKQLGHYASGLKKPRKAQVEKIETSMRSFLNDLNQFHLTTD